MSATFRRQVRKLESTKDALRDQLFDLKSLVRRSFGTLSSEVVDLADQIVAGANDLSEIAICKRLTGDDDGNPSKSVLAVFNKIDSMHNAMEIAGIRRRRVNPTPSGTNLLESSSGGPTVSVDIPVATPAGNPPLSPPPPLSADRPQVENCVEAASHENGTHEERIDSVGVEEVLGAAADEALQAGNYSSTLVQDESIADPNSQVCVGAGPSLVELDSQDAGTRSRHRTCGFSKSDISSVTPSSLREASQLRLDTLITLQREVLAGALQANRRLVAAKRWVADAPLPLAASVDGLLLEIDALKRHLQEESLSLAVASFPMAAPPLRSSHVKAMKQQRKQLGSPRRAVQSPLSPRSASSLGTLRTPQSDPFVPASFLSAKRSGTSFVEGEQAAIETRVKQKEGLQRLQRQQLRVLHHQQSTSAVGDPTLRTMLPIAQALKQREGTSSDDIKKILHAVKVEVHHLGRQPLPMRGVSRGVGNLPVLVQGGGSRESGGAETPAEEILVFCPDNRSTTAETLMTNLHPSNAGITRAGTPCLPVFVPKHHAAQDRSKSSLR